MTSTTCNNVVLDLKELTKRGAFKATESAGKFTWQVVTGEVIAEFHWKFSRSADAILTLQYVVPLASGGTRDATEVIQLTTTPCRFGGVRYWAMCASCECRVRRLYRTENDRRFSCAKCNKLIFPSHMPGPKDVSDFVRHLRYLEDLEIRMSHARSPKRIAALQERIERVVKKLNPLGYFGRHKIAWQG